MIYPLSVGREKYLRVFEEAEGSIGGLREEMDSIYRRNEERKENGPKTHSISLSHFLPHPHSHFLSFHFLLTALELEKNIASKRQTLESLPTEKELKEKIEKLKADFEVFSPFLFSLSSFLFFLSFFSPFLSLFPSLSSFI
jgi:hypothetical protein